jgi:hypothetical protein
MAPTSRRWRARCDDLGQTRTQARSAQSDGGELAQAKRENARLLRRLEHAEAIIDIQKKVAALLGIPLATLPDNGDEP